MGRPIRVAHRVGLHIVVAPQPARRAEAEEQYGEVPGGHQREVGMMALTQQTLDSLHEFVTERGGHYFLTPAEAKDVLALVEALRVAVAVEREACAQIAEAGAIDRCVAHQHTGKGICGIGIASMIRARAQTE